MLDRTYTGPAGTAVTLVAIERRPYDLWRLVLRWPEGGHAIVPASDAAKWIRDDVL